MNASGPNPYLKTKIMTASPEELRMMLYEGAIKFCRQARPALEAKDYETSYNNLVRAQKILLELSTSLNRDVAPELCDKLSALYTYIYRRLIDANIEHDVKAVDEAIELLEYERHTWSMVMKQLGEQRQGGDGSDHAQVAAQQTAMSSLSFNA